MPSHNVHIVTMVTNDATVIYPLRVSLWWVGVRGGCWRCRVGGRGGGNDMNPVADLAEAWLAPPKYPFFIYGTLRDSLAATCTRVIWLLVNLLIIGCSMCCWGHENCVMVA